MAYAVPVLRHRNCSSCRRARRATGATWRSSPPAPDSARPCSTTSTAASCRSPSEGGPRGLRRPERARDRGAARPDSAASAARKSNRSCRAWDSSTCTGSRTADRARPSRMRTRPMRPRSSRRPRSSGAAAGASTRCSCSWTPTAPKPATWRFAALATGWRVRRRRDRAEDSAGAHRRPFRSRVPRQDAVRRLLGDSGQGDPERRSGLLGAAVYAVI